MEALAAGTLESYLMMRGVRKSQHPGEMQSEWASAPRLHLIDLETGLVIEPRLASNSHSPCLSLLSMATAGVCQHTGCNGQS